MRGDPRDHRKKFVELATETERRLDRFFETLARQ